MDQAFDIRAFTPDDAPALTDLLHAAYAELGARGLNYTAVDQSARTTLLRAQAGRCWVADRDGVPVATLTISLPPSQGLRDLTPEASVAGRAWLNQVAVAPDLRGRGLARSLWDRGLEWARAQHAGSVGVDTAVPATHLVHLYERWGFVPVGTIHWPGKTYDSVVMTLDLDGAP